MIMTHQPVTYSIIKEDVAAKTDSMGAGCQAAD
jgi:hypothetical protein